jgi:hypothetical protein
MKKRLVSIAIEFKPIEWKVFGCYVKAKRGGKYFMHRSEMDDMLIKESEQLAKEVVFKALPIKQHFSMADRSFLHVYSVNRGSGNASNES